MKRELKILNTVSALFVFSSGLLGPIYAIFVQRIGGDLIAAGSAYAAFAIVSGVLIFFISKWEERIHHQEKIMVAGFAMGCIGFLGYIFVQNPLQLLMVQIVIGIAYAVRAPVWDSLYSRNLDEGRFTSEWGVWESMNLVVLGASAAIGGMVAETFGFATLFVAMFCVSFAGFLVSVSLMLIKQVR
jgi:MFS family permease